MSLKEAFLKLAYKSLPLALIWLSSCSSGAPEEVLSNQPLNFSADSNLHYAKRFSSSSAQNCRVFYLFGDRNSKDTTATFVLYPKGADKPGGFKKNAFYIEVPVKRVACLSSIYAAMMTRLGLDSTIVAVDNIDYYNNARILKKTETGEIKELAKGPEMNVEQTLVLKPDLVLTFGMGYPEKDVNPKILAAGIPVAISLDHLEETPLARAEWIKFVAAFFGKERQADSLFRITESNYDNLKSLADTVKLKPTVLTEIKYGEAWYVPGGKSFMAHFIKDAGGDYIWKHEDRAGSLPLSFEAVFAKAKDADYWLNLFINLNTKKELLASDERYSMFRAYKTGNLYNNNKIANAKGYSDYWENGMSNPDELLKDLIKIFHPELLPGYELKYYKKIE
jgi:iron complex transport system substrate-binding protein